MKKIDQKILRKKQDAADYFTQKLLQSRAGKDVARIILFGSVARGEADDYSDIDILLFSQYPKKIRKGLWEVLVDAYEKYEESIEPMIYPLKKYLKPDSNFLYQSIKNGRLLYAA